MSAGQVVTLTFSPALDVATAVDIVAPSHKLRCSPARQEPGGGGINVARVAQRLGADAIAIAPFGGAGERMVTDQLALEGVTVEQVVVTHSIRQNFAVTEESTGHQYRFVLPPLRLDEDEAERCVAATCKLGVGAGCVVVSGSINIEEIPEALRTIVDAVGPTPVLIDTSGAALEAALASGAALVKPSARELADIVGRPLDTEADITAAAVQLFDRSNVAGLLVSIGSGGAVLVTRGNPPIRFRAPTVRVRSTIGAGDSLVAGIATGLANGDDLVKAITVGIAAGTATVMTDGTGLCDSTTVHALLPLVTVGT